MSATRRYREAASTRPDQVDHLMPAQLREVLGARASYVEQDLECRCPSAACAGAVGRERQAQDERAVRAALDVHELPRADLLADLGRHHRQRVIVLAVLLV